MADGTMRLDRFLWWARLAKTRSAAQVLASAGRLRCDGRLVERSAAPVRVGNILVFAQGPQVRALRIEALPHRRGPPAEARECYSELLLSDPAWPDQGGTGPLPHPTFRSVS